ncbi:MAG: AAA family ATPase [Candidatus Heimdallarchaeota archaeon]|nr:AAA family ATPase [Candidatus Heimdallarchaeota archaeon]
MTNILVTGAPRTGKTTLISTLISKLNIGVIGFITTEIRENNIRTGFTIETYSGIKKILASKKNLESRYRVGRYGVYLDNLNFIVSKLEKEINNEIPKLIVIDEIGKMELFSHSFREFVMQSLNQNIVLGTIMLRDNDFTKNIKLRSDTKVFEINLQNREKILNKIEELIRCQKDQKLNV